MAIKIKNLTFGFKDMPIFDNCNLEIKDKQMTVIMGLNGVGKSTLFKILTGKIKTNCTIENSFKNIFYLPQNPICPKGITVFDYLSVMYFKNNFKWFLNNEEKQEIIQALEVTKLLSKKDFLVENLSGGEFQKLNLALSIIRKADLLLLDEPVSNLDLINREQVMETIKNLNITSVIILHDLNLASNNGENFIGIDSDNKILQFGKEEFFEPKNLEKVFGIKFKVIKNDEKYFIQTLN